jgi:hypothetical protein
MICEQSTEPKKEKPIHERMMEALVEQEKTIDLRLIDGLYFSINFLTNLLDYGGQPPRIGEYEGFFIQSLAEGPSPFSIHRIARITGRSSSTIFEYLKRCEKNPDVAKTLTK